MRELHVFDLGGVLLATDFERFVRRAGDLLGDVDPGSLREACSGAEKAALDRGSVSPRRFLERLSAGLGRGDADLAALLEAWTGIFDVLPPAPRELARLREAGAELWLMSDTDPAHFARCLNDYPFVRGFDRYLLSYARGRLKVDPGAFEVLAAEVAAGRRVRFVDDREDNVRAAVEAGVDGVVFRGWDRYRAW